MKRLRDLLPGGRSSKSDTFTPEAVQAYRQRGGALSAEELELLELEAGRRQAVQRKGSRLGKARDGGRRAKARAIAKRRAREKAQRKALASRKPGPHLPDAAFHNPRLRVVATDLDLLLPDGWGRGLHLADGDRDAWLAACAREARRAGLTPDALKLLAIHTWAGELRPARHGWRNLGSATQLSAEFEARKLGCSRTSVYRLYHQLDPTYESRQAIEEQRIRPKSKPARVGIRLAGSARPKRKKKRVQPSTHRGGRVWCQRFRQLRRYGPIAAEVGTDTYRSPVDGEGLIPFTVWRDVEGHYHEFVDLRAVTFASTWALSLFVGRDAAGRRVVRSRVYRDLCRHLEPIRNGVQWRLAPAPSVNATPDAVISQPSTRNFGVGGAPLFPTGPPTRAAPASGGEIAGLETSRTVPADRPLTAPLPAVIPRTRQEVLAAWGPFLASRSKHAPASPSRPATADRSTFKQRRKRPTRGGDPGSP